jgi:hypothetical protein
MAAPPVKKHFSYDEARELLPAVKTVTRESIEELQQAREESDENESAAERDARVEHRAAEILGEWAQRIERMGIEVKGPWLVDFDSGAGYYCWKWPEERLEYFHGYEEGFGGRMRIQ